MLPHSPDVRPHAVRLAVRACVAGPHPVRADGRRHGAGAGLGGVFCADLHYRVAGTGAGVADASEYRRGGAGCGAAAVTAASLTASGFLETEYCEAAEQVGQQ